MSVAPDSSSIGPAPARLSGFLDRTGIRWPCASVLADHPLRLPRRPDGDVQMAVDDLDGRGAGQVRLVEMVELGTAQVQSDVVEQVLGEALVQFAIRVVADHAPQLGVAVA